jgi:hypothetical protein
MGQFELYEKTHLSIMSLPSIIQEFEKLKQMDSEPKGSEPKVSDDLLLKTLNAICSRLDAMQSQINQLFETQATYDSMAMSSKEPEPESTATATATATVKTINFNESAIPPVFEQITMLDTEVEHKDTLIEATEKSEKETVTVTKEERGDGKEGEEEGEGEGEGEEEEEEEGEGEEEEEEKKEVDDEGGGEEEEKKEEEGGEEEGGEEVEEEGEEEEGGEEEGGEGEEGEEEEEVEEGEEEVEEEGGEEEEEGLVVVTINGVDYCADNEVDGNIYELTPDGEQGEIVGKYISSKAILFTKEPPPPAPVIKKVPKKK